MTNSDIKKQLHVYLRGAREALVWKLEGLSEYDMRRPLTPTGTNLLGLVKHSTATHLGYFGLVFCRAGDTSPRRWRARRRRTSAPSLAAVLTGDAEPNAAALPVKLTENAEEMLRADLQNENETVRAYRERVRQCDALGEFAMSEQIREILIEEQEHQIDLATALGEDVPDVSKLKR